MRLSLERIAKSLVLTTPKSEWVRIDDGLYNVGVVFSVCKDNKDVSIVIICKFKVDEDDLPMNVEVEDVYINGRALD
jgi:hypothetical protein